MASMFPPKKNTAFTLIVVIRDADGDLVTGATALDSEVSIDGGAFADCTNEATEIGTTGIYTLALTSGEMNGDVIVVQTKTTTSGAKTAVNVIYTSARLNDDLAFPTVSGRSIDVATTGEVGLDFNNVLDSGVAEPGQGLPPATATMAQKIGYLYKAWRNKVTQTSSNYNLFADDATTVDQKATVSDDGTTFTRGEMAAGP